MRRKPVTTEDTAADCRSFLGRLLGAMIGGVLLTKAGSSEAAPQADGPYIGEMRLFAGAFAPNGWLRCEGQLVSINQYESLFFLIGTTYGGDGQNTFALPDLRGRAPVHMGNTFSTGQAAGQETVVLLAVQLPAHAHTAMAGSAAGVSADPAGRAPARNAAGVPHYSSASDTKLAPALVSRRMPRRQRKPRHGTPPRPRQSLKS